MVHSVFESLTQEVDRIYCTLFQRNGISQRCKMFIANKYFRLSVVDIDNYKSEEDIYPLPGDHSSPDLVDGIEWIDLQGLDRKVISTVRDLLQSQNISQCRTNFNLRSIL